MTDTDPTATLTAASHDDLQAIAASQRQELMLAQALDSDLDFAFKLQLQEAISASLTVDEQPSSSTAAAASQIFPPSFDEDVPKYTDLLSDEVLRLEQQLRDHAVSETEFRKCKDDLHRRIHDHRVALEISKMPEDEWEDWGDEFERPFGEGTSKGADDEIFRVYYKGLVEKQSPEGGTVGGLGVAICGPNDDLLFELRKPLSNADLLSGRQSAEYRALIEALSAALELGLERLTFYCDFYLMYKFVSGQWVPKQRKISELVKQVTLLREKFVYCEPYFVPRKDIRFAFKLAREAIISQASKAAETSSSRNSTETCVICTDDADISQIFSIDGCMHRYCFSCMKQHVEVKLLHGMLPTCPHEGCKTKLQLDSCAKFLTPRLIQIMSHRIKEASISVTEKVYCPYPKCSALMSKGEVLEFSKAVFGFAKINGARRCMKCSGNFCIDCKVPWHTRMTCFDYKMRNPYPPIEEAKLKNLAATNLWRQCVKCNHMIELSAGCFHMTCRCGYEFCYTCGTEWKNKKQTCSCPLWDEDYILHRGGDVYENEDEDEDSDEDDFDYFL